MRCGPALRRQLQGRQSPRRRNQANPAHAKVVFASHRSPSMCSLDWPSLVLRLISDEKLGWKDPSQTTMLRTNRHPYSQALHHQQRQLTTAAFRRCPWFQEQMCHRQPTKFRCDRLLPSKSFGLALALPQLKLRPRFNWYGATTFAIFVKWSSVSY